KVAPYLGAMAPGTITALVRDFFATGTAEIDDHSKFALRTVLEGLLKPMGLVRKKGNKYFLTVDPRTNELASFFFTLLEKGSRPPDALYWSLRKGEYGILRNQFEVLVFALIFSGNIVAYQGQRKRGLEDIIRSGLQGITALGKGEILSEETRRRIPENPLVPEKFRKGTFSLPSQEALWAELKELKDSESESLRNLIQRIGWASSFQAFRNLPWEALRRDMEDLLAQWEEVRVSFPAREGLERFLLAGSREPFLAGKIRRREELRDFFEHAERVLFVHQYVTDPRLVIPEHADDSGVRQQREDLVRFFEKDRISIESGKIQDVLVRFREFRDAYIRIYTRDHKRAKGGDRFAPYERVRQSARYQVLARLDRLELISVPHNRASVDRALAAVLQRQCAGPSPESLQSTPVCSCGFAMGEESVFPPLREIEESVDLGIKETLEALASPSFQEKLIPYLSGLETVGEKDKAAAIRDLLALSPNEDDLIARLERALTPAATSGINEAFRGRVVVVRRDLDQLYGALIQRKYTLQQIRKIFREWLKEDEISEATFVQFTGKGEAGGPPPGQDALLRFLEEEFSHILPLASEAGPKAFRKALLFSLWIEGHGVPPSRMIPLFPFLGKGKESGDLLVQELSRAARRISEKNPSLFEELVRDVEAEASTVPEAMKVLEEKTPGEIFRGEKIFSSVLAENFAKRLASPEEEDDKPPSAPPLPGLQHFTRARGEMDEVLRDYRKISGALRALVKKKDQPPGSFAAWENLYIQHLSPVSCLLGFFEDRTRRMKVFLPQPAKETLAEAEAACSSLSEVFAKEYREALPRWESGEPKRPSMIEDVLSLNPWKKKGSDNAERVLVLLDGARWDLWEYLKENFFPAMAHQLRFVQEGALWSHLPSNTSRQLELLSGDSGGKGPENLWKMGGIDERVHTEKGNLEYLFRNVLQYLQLELAPRLRELPPRTQILFFSDHGFVENPGFSKGDKYRSARYTHGEASPFEVIVPWAGAVRI
ncbi:MAG TPA: DUF6079 family protein, partial [Thermodesulfobacteriota bacterium]|nr:DUF6079 family protein [Thermodesulfobacteriota bacterium]